MKLTYIMFTKHLEGLGVPEIIDSLNSVGVQGADLCVHPGYPVNPGNIDQELPRAARPQGGRLERRSGRAWLELSDAQGEQ